MNHLAFVYGTLKKGFHNHHYITESEFIGSGFTAEKYAMYVDGIPYVVKDEPVARIQGEVYSVDNDILVILDQLERHPDWYCREEVEIILNDGVDKIMAWLYFNPYPDGEIVESGIFVS